MSLINKMLKDLEARNGAPGRVERPIFQDLHAVNSGRPRRHGRMMLFVGVLAVAAVGYAVWSRLQSTPVSPPLAGPQAAVATTPLAPVASIPAAVAVPPPVPMAPHKSEPGPQTKPVVRHAGTTPQVKASRISELPSIAAAGSGPARIEKTERPYTREEIAEQAYQEALRARAQGDTAGAESRVQTLLNSDPQNRKVRELLATVQVENGRWPEAQATLEQGVVRSPDYSPFRLQLARLLLERKSLADAIAVLEDARRTNHADAELLAFLAALQQRAGRSSDATKRYQEALALKPGEGRWWVGLGISLESEQKTAEARDAYQKGLVAGALPDSLVRYAEDRLKVLAR